MVIAAYTLGEIPSIRWRKISLASLWRKTKDLLVRGSGEGYGVVRGMVWGGGWCGEGDGVVRVMVWEGYGVGRVMGKGLWCGEGDGVVRVMV